MANPLDVTLLSKFSIVFSMIFVFLIVYAGLSITSILGKNHALNGLIALVAALLLLFAPSVSLVINTMVPWFIVFLIFIFLLLLLFRFMGQSEKDIIEAMSKYKVIGYVIIVLSVIVFLGALGTVFFATETVEEGDIKPGAASEDGKALIEPGDIGGKPGVSTFWATFFHPKVLGFIFIMLIGLFTLLTIPVNPVG